MRTKIYAILFILSALITFEDKAMGWGGLTHMTILDDVLKDPRLNLAVKKILEETMKYAKGGATGPDMHYFSGGRYGDVAHYCSPGDLAKKMLDVAKKDGNPKEIAFAYGWMIHVASDSRGHAWVNGMVGGEYNPNKPEIVTAHRDIEMRADLYNFLGHATGDGKYDTNIAAPNNFLEKVYKEQYGCSKNAPGSLRGNVAENISQGWYNVEPSWVKTSQDFEIFNTDEYKTAYQESIDRAVDALNSAGATLENWDLDTGEPEYRKDVNGQRQPNPNYGGYQKCREHGKLKDCSPVKKAIKTGDFPPDDTVSVNDYDGATEAASLDSLYRLAPKKGKKWMLWLKAAQDANAEYNGLPPDAPPELRQEKLDKISALVSQLNDPSNWREFSVNNPQLFGEIEESPDIAVLENGYFEEMTKLINKQKEAVRIVPLDFSIQILESQPVLIIPSGGLYGLEKSEIIKASLDEYVKQGGTLIVFSQQYGYEFSILPIPQEADGSYKHVGGYGWAEDQSCFYNAAYIETWHQMLAGLRKSTPDIHIDGFLMDYPSNATVLLRRTANGQPALLIYEHGEGRVIVTSMYSDVALKQNQASSEEIALVRDIISWAKKPDMLPEKNPGESLAMSVTLANTTSTDTSSAKLFIYNPDRSTLLSEQSVGVGIPAGQSATIPVTYTTPPTSVLGIYHIDYALYDFSGNMIQAQSETDSGRFAISNPPKSPSQISQLNFSIQSDSEDFVWGSPVTLTINAFNSSDVERMVTAKIYNQNQSMTIPARSSSSFIFVKMAELERGWWGSGAFGGLQASFYEGNKYLSTASKYYRVYFPTADATVNLDKNAYAKGEAVAITSIIKNKLSAGWQPTLRISVWGPEGLIFEDSRTIVLPPSGTVFVSTSYTLPTTAAVGSYHVSASLYAPGLIGGYDLNVGGGIARFELPQSQVSVTPNLPSAFSASTNTIPFTISNTGKVNVSSGTIDLNLKAPDGSIVYSISQPFSIAVRETKTLAVPISIPSPKLGTYVLTYSQSDETRTGYPTSIAIPNSIYITNLSLDKPFYKVRETVNLNTTIKNTGKFNIENISIAVSAPDVNFTESQAISLGVGSSTSLNFTIPIPETISAGRQNVDVVLTLPGGDSLAQNTGMYVPGSSLSARYQGPTTLSAGDLLEMILENTGGFDTNYNSTFNLYDKTGWEIDIKTGAGSIQAGGQTLLSYTLPDQITEGGYQIGVSVTDAGTSRTIYYYSPLLTIAGLKSNVSVQTGKDIYFSNEETTTLSTIVNQLKPMVDGNLYLQIVCAESVSSPPPDLQSFNIYTMDSQWQWTEQGVLHFPPYLYRQELALPISIDEGGGSAYVRMRHEAAEIAFVDYVALRDSNGNLYSPSWVAANEHDITSEVQAEDGSMAEVTEKYVDAEWIDLPSGVSYSLVMRAWEASSCGIIWQTDTTINQGPGTTQTLNISAGNIGQAGKYYLRGELTNSLGQSLGTSYYPFYIIDGDTALLFNTNKRIYRPGETITITGRIENRAPITAENLTLALNSSQGGQNPQLLLTETINLLSGGNYPFTITTTAEGEEGIVSLVGAVKQNNQTLVSITDQYGVANPLVSTYVDAPQTAGNEPFTIEVDLYNDGKVDATVQFEVQSPELTNSQTITIPAFGMKLVQYSQQISKNTTYTFTFTGDHQETTTKTVTYGFGASIQFGVQSSEFGIFPEGSVALPVSIANTGQLAETLAINFTLSPGDITQTKTCYLQAGSNTTDTLYFNLTEGDYQISATSQKPDATAQANFSVRKENQVEIAVSLGTQTDGLIPVNVNLTNAGFNEINGSVNLSVTTGSGQVVWNGEETLSQLSSQGPKLLNFNVNPSAIEPGTYTLQVQLLNNSNQVIATRSLEFGVQSANFRITQLPPYQTFMGGQEATFLFRVKNIGDQEGSFDLRFKAYDLIDSTQREFLKAGEEKTLTFGFILPEDLEEKDYFADFELKSSKVAGQSNGQIKYHLAGISLNVNASLDKPYYAEGETARLTINIQSPNSNPQNLFARMNYAGYEPEQTFTLNGTQVLIFDVPLPKITGEKLFYGIYHEGGRSIHLNSVYIHKTGDVITITTNKQVYDPGEMVSVTASGNTSGNMTLSGPGGYSETVSFSGQLTRSFTLPAMITAGTYFINVQLATLNSELVTVAHPFDVAGIQVKVLECNNDKGKYASSDNITTSFTISTNTTMPAVLKAWIVDPTGQYVSVGEQNITLSSSESSLATYNSPLSTSVSGIHRLVYGIYGPEDLPLCSGSEAFDVGDAVLLGASTEKVDYPQGNESVVVKMSLYGSITASLEFYLDGQSAGSQSVSLNGFSTLDYILPFVTPGPHALKVVLTAGGLTSTKEITFSYGSELPDLTLQLSWDQVIVQSNLSLTIKAINQGKNSSGPTTLHLYDGEISEGNLLSTFDIPILPQKQSQTFTYTHNLLGRAGANTLSGVIDPSNAVYEFNESNNRDQITFTMPEVTLSTTLEKDAYFPGETVPITSLVTNLSRDLLAGLALSTEVKDQAGGQVFTTTQNIPRIEAMATVTLLTSWSPDPNLPEGVYTICQSILGKEIHTEKNLTFTPGKDFTITTDTAIKKIEIGEAAGYHLQLIPVKAFKGEIHLSLSGYPDNSTAYFTPNPVTIVEGHAESILTVVPPGQTGTGSYSMKVNATAGGISHDLDLSLSLTDFEMILHPMSQTLPQTEKANYTLTLNPLNDFDHGVTLEINDIPAGMRASLNIKEVNLPGSVTLTLETSKWLLPGEYRIPIAAKARTVTHILNAFLIVQKNPLNVPGIMTVPGLLNKPIIRTFGPSGGLLSEFQVVDGGLGVNISAGDVNGDGVDEAIAGTGWKLLKTGRLGIFRRDGAQVALMETEQGYVSDLTVAAGDFDGDWIEEVVLGFYKSPLSDPLHAHGGVQIYKVIGNRFIDTGLLFHPYESEGYFGPPALAVADVDGDGVPELITAPGPDPLAPAKIKVFKINTATEGQWSLETQLMDFIVPFNVSGFGARVAAADLDGDGRAEIIVGAGPDPRKKAEVVVVYHGDEGYTFKRFTAYPGLLFGVNVAAMDVDEDGVPEILTGPGPDLRAKSKVRIFRKDGTLIREFQAYPDNVRFGVKVSTGRIGE